MIPFPHILHHILPLNQSPEKQLPPWGWSILVSFWPYGPETVQEMLGTAHIKGHPEPPSFFPFPPGVITSGI